MNVLPTIQPNNSVIAFLIVIVCLGTIGIILLCSKYLNIWQQTRSLVNIKFSPRKFRELAATVGLSETERIFLENYFHHTKTMRFMEIFYDRSFSQSIMRSIYRTTYTHPEKFGSDSEFARCHIFNILQKLDNFMHRSVFASNTRKIVEGSCFYLNICKKNNNNKSVRFIGRMRSNYVNYFEVQLLNGSPSDIPKRSEVELELFKTGDRAIYTSKVQGYSRKRKHNKLLVMGHGKKIKIIFGARRYKRKQFQILTTIVAMRREGNNFKIEGEVSNALICDISITGCGILCHLKYPINSFIGVSYINPHNNETVKFICEIIRHTKLNDNDMQAVILQSRIEEIAYYDKNQIAAFVYEFEKENDKIKKLQLKNDNKTTIFDSNTAAILRGRS